MRVIRWIKTWAPLFVAVIALALSGYAIYVDNVHYQEVTRPHTKHDEIYDRLTRLDDKIERAEQSIGAMQDLDEDIGELQNNLRKAKGLRDQAELAWDEGLYTDADKFIGEAYDILQEIPPPKPVGWWLIGAIIGGGLIIGLIMLLVVGGRQVFDILGS